MLNLSTPINTLSYGLVGSNICEQLVQQGQLVFLNPIGPVDIPEEIDSLAIKKCMDSPFKLAPSLRIYHQFNLHEHIGKIRHIGFPIFELDNFNNKELDSIRMCDELFVCSTWAQKVMARFNIGSKVVPLGVNTDIFNSDGVSSSSKTIFLNIGKLEKRKGHDFMAQVFKSAFPNNENVELWLMADSIFNDPNIYNEVKREYHQILGDRVRFLSRLKSQQEVASVIKRVDCGFYPSRAEGFNLPLLETLACGRMAITTNYSAHTEFCNQENSMLIHIEEVEQAIDNRWFHGQGNWATIGQNQIDQMIHYLRMVHKNKQENGHTLNKSGVETGERFTWSNTTNTLISFL